MVIRYRGFELQAERVRVLAGYKLLHLSAVRTADGWVLMEDMLDCADPPQAALRRLMRRVDTFFRHPEGENAPALCLRDREQRGHA